jgi:hypothetical protein
MLEALTGHHCYAAAPLAAAEFDAGDLRSCQRLSAESQAAEHLLLLLGLPAAADLQVLCTLHVLCTRMQAVTPASTSPPHHRRPAAAAAAAAAWFGCCYLAYCCQALHPAARVTCLLLLLQTALPSLPATLRCLKVQ